MSRRLLAAAFHLLALSFLIFALTQIAPGDVFSESRLDPRVRAESVEQWRTQLHLNEPWWQRYGSWCQHAAAGNLGHSLAYGMPVTALTTPRLRRTLQLVVPAWMLSWLLGLSLAACSVRAGIWKTLEQGAAMAQLIPEAVLASLFCWLFLVRWQGPADSVWLPLLPLTLALTPVIFLHTAGALDAARQSRFVRLAGLAQVNRRVLWLRYLAPAVANPLVSLLGPSFVAAFGSALVVEVITAWPGLGALLVDSFRSRDYPVTQAVLLLVGVLLLALNLLGDLLLYRLDPRLRAPGDHHAA